MQLSKIFNVKLINRNSKLSSSTIWQTVVTQQFRQIAGASNINQKTDAQIEWENARPITDMPTPGGLKSLKEYFPGGKYYKKDTVEMANIMREQYGDSIYIPGYFKKPPMVLLFDPKDFEKVFRNEGIWPQRYGFVTLNHHRSELRAGFFQGTEGLLSTDGEKWGTFRSKVNPALLQPKNVRLYYQKMSQVNQEFIERIKAIRDPKTNEVPANFEDIINRWTLESVSVVALDRQLGLLSNDTIDPLIQKLLDSITAYVALAPELEVKPSLWQYISTPKYKRAMKALDNNLEITTHFVNNAIQRLEEEEKNGIVRAENEKSVLEKLLKIDRKIALVMAMDMLMAGVDTTSSTFAGIMLNLAQNPEKQNRLREEIRRILPNKDSEFTEASINDMSYLRACIKESLRLYPLTIGNARTLQRDVVLNNYRVPKGTSCTMLSTHTNRDEQYFPQADKFLPERWLRTGKNAAAKECPNSLKTNNPFVYLPFGFGPRSCIGRRIAELELELGVARIIRNFNVSYNYSTKKAFKVLLINIPNIPLKFQFTDIEN